jgi:hypothetical protein
MEIRYLAGLIGLLHIYFLFKETFHRDKDVLGTSARIVHWTPCTAGSTLFIAAVPLLVFMVRGVVPPFWLLLLLLELSQCSEVSVIFGG